MNKLLEILNWVIRLKQKGEGHDVSKSTEKFKWYSVILEFIQNTIDSNIKFNKGLREKNNNHQDLPAHIKISFTKVKFSDFVKNFITKKFKSVLGLSRLKPGAVKELEGQDHTDLLILEDFNTQGILGDHRKYSSALENGKDNPIFRFNFYVGDDQKLDDPDLGGSEGEGRQTFYYASKISTFFYYTIRENKIPLFYGMTFVGNAKDENGKSWMPVLRYGEEVVLKGELGDGDDKIPTDLSYAIPSENEECNKIFKNIIPIKRDNETGTSIVIPYYDRRYLKKDRVISKIIEVYRVLILRGQLVIEIDDEIINSSTIDKLCAKYSTSEEIKLQNTLKYFGFLKEIDNKNYEFETYLNYTKGINFFDEKIIPEFHEFTKHFNAGKIVKLRCNYNLNKKVDGRVGDREKNINTFFDLYLKKSEDQIRSYQLNDFIRGSLSIYDEKKKLDCFALVDVQDDEAKLFFKCAEGANHSIWDPTLWKLDNYYTETYGDVVRFAKKAPEQILRLIEAKDTRPDYDTFSDLFPDLSDEGKKKKKKKKKQQKIITPPFVPNIYGKLKNYEVDETKQKDGGFYVKGNSFEKKEIISKISEMGKDQETLIEFINKEEDEDKKEILSNYLVTIKRRIKEYEQFVENGCDNFPINIRLKMAFEGENLGNPFKKYDPKKHFDLDKNKEFNFNIEGDVTLKKCSENVIVLSASSSNFKFLLTGFSKISNYDVAVQDKEEQI